MYGEQITITTAGSVKWVGVYLYSATAVDITIAIYRPDFTLLGYTEERSISTAGWYIFRVLTPINVAKGDELVVMVGCASSYSLYYASTSGRAYYVAQDYTYFPPARPALTADTAHNYSIFVAYTEGDSFDTRPGAGCPNCSSSEY
jgi:hypothetical protein